METTLQKMNIAELLSEGWEYRGEGNANVAISLPAIQKILRIPKSEKPKSILGWIIDWLKVLLMCDYKKHMKCERRNLEFYNFVMVPLFGHIFAQPAIEIRTIPSIIRKLDREIMPFRPDHRQHKRLQFWSASLLTDYTFLPRTLHVDGLGGATFSVEIKPKQGWIPESDRQFNNCLFCSNQFLKMIRGEVFERSLYCPLDLFSGDKRRIFKALKALIQTPQNNLRIFINGSYWYGENTISERIELFLCEFFGYTSTYNEGLLNNFCFILLQSVLKNFEEDVNVLEYNFVEDIIPEPAVEDKCSFTQHELPEGCILQKILNVQKLNRLGLNQYRKIYEEVVDNRVKTDNWGFMNKFLIVPYLLAAVAYDCSFMITLQRLNGMSETVNKRHLISNGIHKFLVNISVFDLYPKPADTIKKHMKRNAAIQYVCSCRSEALLS